MANLGEVTVQVHINIDLNGEPVTRVLNMPASIEPPDNAKGLTVHLDLNARLLAKALLPDIMRLIRDEQGLRGHLPCN